MKAICEDENAASRPGEQKGGGISAGADGGQPLAIRNGLICAFVVAACLWAAYPVAELGFVDDWSYVQVAQAFAQTGHFVYNGWESAILGWQVAWGALFIKLFGFSFTVVRLSMLPIAMATVFLFHAILLRFGVNSRNAVFGTLTLGLSPLFLPLAATYMTDVSGLFVVLLCLYLCQRAVAARSDRATIAWLCLAAATNVVGGTARQIAWLGALVMIPSAGWLLRKRQGVLLAALLLWALSIVGVFACMHWFARQPYTVTEPLLRELALNRAVLVSHAFRLFLQLIGTALCLSLVAYPILVAWLPEMRRLNRSALLCIAWGTLFWVLFQLATRPKGWTLPWLSHVIQTELAAPKVDAWLKSAPLFLPIWALEAISTLVMITALIFLGWVWGRVGPLVRSRTVPIDSRRDVFWLLGPFSLCYFVLLLPRAYHVSVFDRYLLPIMAVAIICLLMMHQRWIAPRLPAVSVAVMAIFALVAIAGTHDWFAWSRARVAAVNEVRASGVPKTDIQAGYEYDGWTQLEISQHMNGEQFLNDILRTPISADDCTFRFDLYTPAIHPRFTTIFPKMWCLAPSKYPPVNYRTWLPPFKGTILVQEIPNGSD